MSKQTIMVRSWHYTGQQFRFRLRTSSRVCSYLESSSNKKELLTALFESSVIRTLIFAITCNETKGKENDQQRVKSWRIRKIKLIFDLSKAVQNTRRITSGETLWVPYLSSQYIVLIRYSCWTLNTCSDKEGS